MGHKAIVGPGRKRSLQYIRPLKGHPAGGSGGRDPRGGEREHRRAQVDAMDLRPWGHRDQTAKATPVPFSQDKNPATARQLRQEAKTRAFEIPAEGEVFERTIDACDPIETPEARLHLSQHQTSGTIGVINATSASTRAKRRPTLGSRELSAPRSTPLASEHHAAVRVGPSGTQAAANAANTATTHGTADPSAAPARNCRAIDVWPWSSSTSASHAEMRTQLAKQSSMNNMSGTTRDPRAGAASAAGKRAAPAPRRTATQTSLGARHPLRR